METNTETAVSADGAVEGAAQTGLAGAEREAQPEPGSEADRARAASHTAISEEAQDASARPSHARPAGEIGDDAREAWKRMREALKRPPVGAGAAGAVALAAAVVWGAPEAAVGVLAAYGVYRALKRRGKSKRDTRDAGDSRAGD